jgi:hypothetical protein
MTFVGGTGIDSVVAKVGSATSVTFNIDSTVTTLTGTQTLTNKTLTSPALTTPTIASTGAIFNGTTGTTTVVRKVKGPVKVPDLKDVQVAPAPVQQEPILTAPTPAPAKKRGAFWGKPLPE